MLAIMDDPSAERFVARRVAGWRRQGSSVILDLEGTREPDRTDVAAVLAGARLNDALDRAELAISVLENGAVRLQLGPGGALPLTRDLGLLADGEPDAAPLSVTSTDAGLHLASERHGQYGPDPEDITLEIVFAPFNLTVLNVSSEPVVRLAAEGPETEALPGQHRPAPLAWMKRMGADSDQQRAVTVSIALEPNERLFGLGERAGPLNLVGSTQTTAALPAVANSEQQPRPPLLLSSRGYGLLLLTRAAISADLAQSQPTEYTILAPEPDLDLLIFPSNWPRTALSNASRMIHQPERPPIGIFGVGASGAYEQDRTEGAPVRQPRTTDEMRATIQRALTGGLAQPGHWHAALDPADDTPGFPISPGLAARWQQLALLAPRVGAATTASAHPEVVRVYMALRYRLLPYLLHCAQEAADAGLPMLRPLLLEHSWDADAVNIDDQLLLGRDMLLAPIFSDEEGPVTRRVYLPGYANWYDWWTGVLSDGRQWIETTASLDRLPIYIRAGTAIPLADPQERVDDGPVPVTRLLLFAPKDGAIGSSIELADDELMGVEQERGDRKARLYLEGIPSSVRDLEIVGLPVGTRLVDASAPSITLGPGDDVLPGQGAHWASLTVQLDQGAFTAGLELAW
jgi:hypothetical protein